MAKQLVGPLERHLEKGILAFAGLLLIVVIAMYVVTSPNERELDGETVTPGTIDARLAQRAHEVQGAIGSASADAPSVEPLFPDFDSLLDPFERSNIPVTLASAVSIGPDVPIVDRASSPLGQKTLVSIPTVTGTAVTSGRSTFVLVGPGGNEIHSARNWVTVSAVIDAKEQMAQQRSAYGASNKRVYYGPTELQRRTQRSDGSWSDADWEDIEPWPRGNFDPPPVIRLIKEGDAVFVPDDTEDMLAAYIHDLWEPLQQLDMLRPSMEEIKNGNIWRFPVITSYSDVVKQDTEFLFPNDPTHEVEDRYAAEVDLRAPSGGGKQLTFGERKKEHLAAFDRFMKSARVDQDAQDAIRAYNQLMKIKTDPEASATDKTKVARLMQEAEQLENDINRQVLRGRVRPGGAPNARPGQVLERQPYPTQQTWVHDARLGGVKSGETYQYRLRQTIYNRLAGEPEKFRDKPNGAVVFLHGEWSEPVEVSISSDTVFFLTSKEKSKEAVKVEFYKWEEGVWVKSRRFSFAVGDKLAGDSRADLPLAGGASGSFKALVDFDVDRSIVEIDFGRSYRERKKAPGSKSGVKFAGRSKACSVVFVDAAGRLHERFVPTDKTNWEKKDIDVWKP